MGLRNILWMLTILMHLRVSFGLEMSFSLQGTDRCPQGHVIHEISLERLKLCSATCLQVPQCLGFCYDVTQRLCRHLSSDQTTALQTAISASGFKMYCAGKFDGYTRFDGKSYRVFNILVSLSEAIDKCATAGAVLAMPLNAIENQNIKSLSSRVGLIWIYSDDQAVEGSWISTNTGQQLNYTNWGGADPNEGTRANCMVMFVSGVWYDVVCGRKSYNYVCEKLI